MQTLTVDVHRELMESEAIREGHNDQVDEPEPGDSDLSQWAQLAYLSKSPAEVSLAIIGTKTIQSLNAQYREKDKATNVLAFPADMEFPLDTNASEQINVLGDIVFCSSVIAREAREQNKPIENHWAHMCIHGMLHLQGYDHIEKDEAEAMEALEIKLLAKLDIPNPYISDC